MVKANDQIRQAAKSNNIPLWRIADKLNLSEWTLVRRLRKELPEEQKETILGIIDELKSV